MNPDDENNTDLVEDMGVPTFGGRPPVFETPEDMQEQISGYFNGGMKKRKIAGKDGKIHTVPIPTITGLCLYLGFDSRQSFYDYEKKPEFSYTIKKARMFIENEYEEILVTTGNAGAIFALKNFGWRDERQLSLSADSKELSDEIRGFSNEPDDLEPGDPGAGEPEGDDVPDDGSDASTEPTGQTP